MSKRTRFLGSAVGIVGSLALIYHGFQQWAVWAVTAGFVGAIAAFRYWLIRLQCPACHHVHFDGSGKVTNCMQCGTELAPSGNGHWRGRVGWWVFGGALIGASWAWQHVSGLAGMAIVVLGAAALFLGFQRQECTKCGTRVLSPQPLAHCQSCGARLHEGDAPPAD